MADQTATPEKTENMNQTMVRESRKPFEISSYIATPPDWVLQDIESTLPFPRRKRAKVSLNDADSFIEYSKRHGSLSEATVWCNADYTKGNVDFVTILNDHGENNEDSDWRDNLAKFAPKFSTEWMRWFSKNGAGFSQSDFAAFMEENMKDVAGVEGSPTGAQMLEMALAFEANQDLRFKSAIRLQNGSVQLAYSENDDSATLQKMQMFDRFSLGLPVFWGGDAYQIDARLRYRAREGKVSFWFELIRSDKVLEAATKTLIEKIKAETGLPFFFGNPFVS